MKKILFILFGVFVVIGAFAAGENIPTSKSYVDSKLGEKQDIIPANDGTTQVLTNTGTAGEYGTKGIYDANGAYATQTQNLVDAATMNAGVQNAIDSEFQCIEYNESGECLLMDVFGPSPQQIIPHEYTQIEYIESDGSQYIGTGIKLTNNVGFMVTYSFTEIKSLSYILGSYTPHYYLGITSTGNMLISYGPTADHGVLSIAKDKFSTETYTAKVNYNNSHIAEFVGIKSAVMPEENFSSDRTMYLFRLNNGALPSKSRIYKLQITDGTELVRNFIPARRNSDGVLGMYDMVTNTFFTNHGSGKFIGGPVVYLPVGN